ncbi:MAG: hypothetical protein ACOCRX_08770 [Candidatus Woesearchaeota archaeon]
MGLKDTIEEIKHTESNKLAKDITAKSYSFLKRNYPAIRNYMASGIIENYENYFYEIYKNSYENNSLKSIGDISYFGLSMKEYNFIFDLNNHEENLKEDIHLSKKDYRFSLISSKVLNLYDIILKEHENVRIVGDIVKSINNNFYINNINEMNDLERLRDVLGYLYGIKNGINLVNKISSNDNTKKEFRKFYNELNKLGTSFSFRNEHINKEFFSKDTLEKIIFKEDYTRLKEIFKEKKLYRLVLLDKEYQENIYKLIKN